MAVGHDQHPAVGGELIHKAFSGSGKALVMAALRSDKVSDAERAEIQQFLEDTRDE